VIVRSRAPLRLGLAGGGTDVSPYCDEYGGAVLNATIDLYAYAVLEPLDNGRVHFVAADIGREFEADAAAEIEIADPLVLHRAVYRRIVSQFNGGRPLPCRLTTFCDAPPGSGLGTSSTMVVALIQTFVEWLNLPLGEYEVAHLAFEIERVDAGLGGGRQDQYAATFGGVNFMEFHSGDRVIVNPLRVKGWIMSELETSVVLFDSGTSRSSASIIAEQSANLRRGSGTTLEAMHELKRDSYHMKECLLRGDFDRLAVCLRKSWDAKKRLAGNVSTGQIDLVVETALAAGARAGKVSGAGGGGFVTFLVHPERRMDVLRVLAKLDGRTTTCHFTQAGAEGWKIL
jgi:D-glycero-alpha-D-manno-heptose-7-phosphate kinase